MNKFYIKNLAQSKKICYLCSAKRSILGCTSAIQVYLIAFGLHEHCTEKMNN